MTIPFGLSGPRQSTVVDTSRLTAPIHNQSRFSNSTVIFSKEIPQNQSGSSTDLKMNDQIEIQFGNKLLTVKVLEMKDSTKKEDALKMYEIISEKRIETDEKI